MGKDSHPDRSPPRRGRPSQPLAHIKLALFTQIVLILIGAAAIAAAKVTASRDDAVPGDDDYDDDERTLLVHVVPHTHDDVGWLKTVDQYYYGRNNSIAHAQVRYILDTVVTALGQNPNRTFTYVEMAFFSKWWYEQTEDTRDAVRIFVKDGRLTFSNGGWCMHDEAATHYMGMIDQTTLGHDFLKRELGVLPRVGWQLDPFGHSSTQASLMTSRMGFDALFFGRIDHQDLEKRHRTAQCEGLWEASEDLEDNLVFWGLTGSYMGNYGPPSGFCFAAQCEENYLIGEDKDVLLERLRDFLRKIKEQSDRTKGRNVMLTWGEDFQYENAIVNFENLDFLIESVSEFQKSGEIDIPIMFDPNFDRVKVFYSTPDRYAQYKNRDYLRMVGRLDESNAVGPLDRIRGSVVGGERKEPWDTKKDDFFPYADCDHCYWTGYFTSRPALKRLERVGSSFLHMARQVESFVGEQTTHDERIDTCTHGKLRRLEEAMGVAQHHDGVSGTSMQHVAYDYAKQIQAGINDVEEYIVGALRKILLAGDRGNNWNDISYCQRLNETVCEVAQLSTRDSERDLYIVVYNALASQSDLVVIPVTAKSGYTVERLIAASGVDDVLIEQQWEGVKSILVPNPNNAGISEAAPYMLYFAANNLPALGAMVFRIRISARQHDTKEARRHEHMTSELPIVSPLVQRRSLRSQMPPTDVATKVENLVVSNEHIRVEFKSGLIARISSTTDDSVAVAVKQHWGYYTSYAKEGDQSSGAYIFRPETPGQELIPVKPDPSKSHVFESSLVTEVHVGFEVPWIKQITRIKEGQPYVEIEYTIGPIPIDDNKGKEIVTRYDSGIENKGIFYTDSNGREFMKRRRSFRPTWNLNETEPVAGNYYPVNAAIYVEDDAASMSLLVDRSQGGSSLSDGSIELMVHRRTVADDGRGVREPINETNAGIMPYPPYGDATRMGEGIIISGTHHLLIGRKGKGARLARSFMDKTFSQPHVFAASVLSGGNVPFSTSHFSALQEDLPKNIMLITYSMIDSSKNTMTFLLRFGHQYATGEDDELSKPVSLDLEHLLAGYEVISVVEMTLSGNQELSSWVKKKLSWYSTGSSKGVRHMQSSVGNESMIEINPMEIRTFEVCVHVL